MVLEGTNPFPKEFITRYYEKRWWSGIPLGEMLDRTCDLYPYKEALVAEGDRLTYQQLRDWTDGAAIAFLELGIEKLDRVLLQIPNWAEFVYGYYGPHKIGAIPVMCIPCFSQREMEHFCKVTEAKSWRRSAYDITLIATPVTHNMAIEASINPAFLTGGKVVMIPSTRPKEILETIEKEKVTTTILSPMWEKWIRSD